MKITKNTVISALLFEALGACGEFFRSKVKGYFEGEPCEVCAVGGVLRVAGVGAGAANRITESLLEQGCGAWSRAAPGNYLAALSILYENLLLKNDDLSLPELRELLIDWAEETIPDDWYMDVAA